MGCCIHYHCCIRSPFGDETFASHVIPWGHYIGGSKKITSRTTGARGCEFELFQNIFNYIEQFCRSLLSILLYLGLFWNILVYLGASWYIYITLSLSRAILSFLGLSWTILDYLDAYCGSRCIMVYLGLSQSILSFLGLSQTLLGYLGLSRAISDYLKLARAIMDYI